MSDKDEQREQEEQIDVEGHMHGLVDEEGGQMHGMHGRTEDDDDTPDVEGHKRSMSPARKKSMKKSTDRF